MEAEHYPFKESVNPYMLPEYERTTIKLSTKKYHDTAKIDAEAADLVAAIPQVLCKPYAMFEAEGGGWVFFGKPLVYWTVDAVTKAKLEVSFPSSSQLAVYVDEDLWVVKWPKVAPVVDEDGKQLRGYSGLGEQVFPT